MVVRRRRPQIRVVAIETPGGCGGIVELVSMRTILSVTGNTRDCFKMECQIFTITAMARRTRRGKVRARQLKARLDVVPVNIECGRHPVVLAVTVLTVGTSGLVNKCR